MCIRDSIGGAGGFGNIYVPAPEARHRAGQSRAVRRAFLCTEHGLRERGAVPAMLAKGPAARMLPLTAGRVFHLGGRTVKVLAAGGHTPGGAYYPVSYTHLDVHKRQACFCFCALAFFCCWSVAARWLRAQRGFCAR